MRLLILAQTAVLALAIAGCATASPPRANVVKSSEHECRLQTDPARCKLNHDLAGGYPFALSDR